MEPEKIFLIFFVVWASLAVTGIAFFFRGENGRRKRTLFPYYNYGSGALFIFVVYLITPVNAVLLMAIPAILLISYINHTQTRFCGCCGNMAMKGIVGDTAMNCSKCGTSLE